MTPAGAGSARAAARSTQTRDGETTRRGQPGGDAHEIARPVADHLVGDVGRAAAGVASGGLDRDLPIEACAHFQLMVTTCTGSAMPLRLTSRGSESANLHGCAVCQLASTSPPCASPAMRAASWTPLPR